MAWSLDLAMPYIVISIAAMNMMEVRVSKGIQEAESVLTRNAEGGLPFHESFRLMRML